MRGFKLFENWIIKFLLLILHDKKQFICFLRSNIAGIRIENP